MLPEIQEDIDDYHKGKIRVSKSVIDQGTTIEISLKQITD